MIDLILPETDGGVLAQLVAVLVLGVFALGLTRKHRDWRLIAVGATVLTVALIGLRALH